MRTFGATNQATFSGKTYQFDLDFDKKKLTPRALQCESEHQRLQFWTEHPLMCAHFKSDWETRASKAIYALTWGDSKDTREVRLKAINDALFEFPHFNTTSFFETLQKGLRKNNSPARLILRAGLAPSSTEHLTEHLNAFKHWRENSKPLSTEIYDTLLTVYHLNIIQPMGGIQTALNFVLLHQCLQKKGFGVIADYIMTFYAEHEDSVSACLASCANAQGKKYNIQPWFGLFIEAWEWALIQVEAAIRCFCLQACYVAHAQTLLSNQILNERQYQLALQLQSDQTVREKKALLRSFWYKALYRGLTKRTEERDFNLLCECGFIEKINKNEFKVGAKGRPQ